MKWHRSISSHSSKSTHLAGIDTSLQSSRTQHAVVQDGAVDVRCFAARLRDEEDLSVQQLAAVPLCGRGEESETNSGL